MQMFMYMASSTDCLSLPMMPSAASPLRSSAFSTMTRFGRKNSRVPSSGVTKRNTVTYPFSGSYMRFTTYSMISQTFTSACSSPTLRHSAPSSPLK